jgi:AcrR family transcriptional regulator
MVRAMATTELSADTRARILEAAWALVRERGSAAVSVKDIAAAAGVSRQLVYFHYANRAGLLLAMSRDHDRRSGFVGRVVATRALPGPEQLEALLSAWCAYVPELLPVARPLEAAYVTGDDGASAWRDRMNDLREALRIAVAAVEGDGRLAAGWTVDRATDWVWARVQPSGWEYLVGLRGWSAEDYVQRTVSALLAEVVAPAGGRGATARRRARRP